MRRNHLRLQSLEARDVPNGTQLFAVAEDGGQSRVAVYKAAGEEAQAPGIPGATPLIIQHGQLLTTFTPFPGFKGGVRVAVGDVTGDGVDDLVCAAGPGGGPHVKVYNGASLLNGSTALVKEFFAFDANFRGGVYVAVGEMTPWTAQQSSPSFPQKQIIVGAGEGGGPHVKVFSLNPVIFIMAPPNPMDYFQLQQTREFFAYDKGFRGGVRVAAADVNGDNRDDIVTGAGPGGGPHVRVFDVPEATILSLPPYTHAVIDEFMAYGSSFHGGVYVAAGNVTGNSQYAEVATGAGAGGGPHLKVFSREATGRMQTISETFVGSSALTSGVRVGMADLSNGTAGSFTIYVGRGFDPLAIYPAGVESRLAGYSYHGGTFAGVSLDLPLAFTGNSGDSLNVGE